MIKQQKKKKKKQNKKKQKKNPWRRMEILFEKKLSLHKKF